MTRILRRKNPRSSFDPLCRVAALAGCLLLGPLLASAQLREYSLGTGAAPQGTAAPRTLRTEALTLPFFDDFSLATNGLPDPTLWQMGGGTVVNNTLALNHPSLNVVTFDGLSRARTPYDFSSELAQGATDTLASQVLDLSGIKPADSLYLSFFWQAKGLGELPDRGDSLRLQFLSSDGLWRTVWKAVGGVAASNQFAQVLLPLRAAGYFHAGFQFRFEAFGRLSGAFDTWHLDYVYLNKNRRATDRFYKDVAIRRQPSPYLRRYTAMPLKQYLVNPAAETTDTLQTEIVNLFSNNNFTTLRLTLRELNTRQVLQQYVQPVSENIGVGASQLKTLKPNALPAAFAGPRATLRSTFDLLTTDDQNPSIPGVNLRRNDTLSAQTTLDDYYAYDDGTAEYAADINQRLGRVAVRFVLNRPDAVRAVRMHLAPYRKNLVGQSFTVQILANQAGKPGRTLGQQAFAVRYAPVPDGLVELALSNAVAVSDTFYVAWLQLSEDPLPVGLDKNTDFGRQILYNLGAEWVPNTSLKGSFLLRPVLGGRPDSVVTSTKEEITAETFRVFPNPSAGEIQWNDGQFEFLEVLGLNGQTLRRLPIAGQRGASLPGLPAGVYLLKFSDSRRTFLKRLLITQ